MPLAPLRKWWPSPTKSMARPSRPQPESIGMFSGGWVAVGVGVGVLPEIAVLVGVGLFVIVKVGVPLGV